MATIVDKRFTSKDGAIGNRQKFIKRYKDKIKEAIKKNIQDQSIKDFKFKGQRVKIKGIDGDMDLPSPDLDPSNGVYEDVGVGNKQFNKGDLVDKPKKGQGQGSKGSPNGGSEDEYTFDLSEKEFMELFFEDLELPDMTKKNFLGDSYEIQRMGYSNNGGPSSLNLMQTMKRAIIRILALKKKNEEDELIIHDGKVILKPKKKFVLESTDLKYNYRDKVDLPVSKAVMFCLMDVSGSMGSTEKDIAKRFFILLNRFLRKNYTTVEVVFIRHAEWAEECSEDEFFYSRTSGGTIISTGYERIIEVIKQRYNHEQWNIYVAQATDGDNYDEDNNHMADLLTRYLLPVVQYFAFIEIGHARTMRSNVFDLLERISQSVKNLAVQGIKDYNEIIDVFRSLFAKEKK